MHPQFTDKARKTCRSTWMRFEECFLRGTIITHALFGDDWGRFVHFRYVWCHFMCSCFLTFWLEYEWLPHPVRTALVPFRTFLQAFMCIGKLARHHPQLPKLAPGIAQRSGQHCCHKFEPNRTARPSSEIRSLITSRTFEAPVHGLIVSSTPSNPKPGPPSCNLETLH